MSDQGAAASSPLGKVLGGKYRLVRLLGAGGMGEVFEAEHMMTGGRFAVKFLRPEFAIRNEIMRRFQQEATSAARIGHPNIVAIIDLDRDPSDGSLYIVQELLVGEDLRHHLNTKRRLSPVEAVRIALPVLSALAAAHDASVLHRDIKPPNIFLCENPMGGFIPKVIDFGVAKVMNDEEAGQTRQGMLIGTLSYMSPEQLTSDPTIDGRSDIWAMGVVLYEMLAGRCPFTPPSSANIASIARFAQRVCIEPAPRLEEVAPGTPASLAAVVHRALEVNRERRFPTMRAFLDALSSCISRPAGGTIIADEMASTIIGLDDRDVSFVSAPGIPAAPAGAMTTLVGSSKSRLSSTSPLRSGSVRLIVFGFLVLAGISLTIYLVLGAMKDSPPKTTAPPESTTSEPPARRPAAPAPESPTVVPLIPTTAAAQNKTDTSPSKSSRRSVAVTGDEKSSGKLPRTGAKQGRVIEPAVTQEGDTRPAAAAPGPPASSKESQKAKKVEHGVLDPFGGE